MNHHLAKDNLGNSWCGEYIPHTKNYEHFKEQLSFSEYYKTVCKVCMRLQNKYLMKIGR